MTDSAERITILQAQELYKRIIYESAFFGIEESFNEEALRLYREIGKGVCEENGVVWGAPNNLSKETVLGKRSRAAFLKLRDLVGATLSS